LASNQQVILQQAISQGLFSLGEPIMKTIKWHLAAHGIFVDSSDKIDLRTFHYQLQQIIGNMADVVLDEVYHNLVARYPLKNNRISSSDSAINKIEKLLDMFLQGGSSK